MIHKIGISDIGPSTRDSELGTRDSRCLYFAATDHVINMDDGVGNFSARCRTTVLLPRYRVRPYRRGFSDHSPTPRGAEHPRLRCLSLPVSVSQWVLGVSTIIVTSSLKSMPGFAEKLKNYDSHSSVSKEFRVYTVQGAVLSVVTLLGKSLWILVPYCWWRW